MRIGRSGNTDNSPLAQTDSMNPDTDQGKILAFLAKYSSPDEHCWPFDSIAEHVGLDRKKVARACRSLRTKGLAECKHGLWTEDGTPAGSGYCATAAGVSVAPPCDVEVYWD